MFSSIDYTVTNLNHKIHTADELAHLHASLTSTQLSLASHISKINSKLEAFNTRISEKEGKQSVELVKMHESVTAHAQQLSLMISQHKKKYWNSPRLEQLLLLQNHLWRLFILN